MFINVKSSLLSGILQGPDILQSIHSRISAKGDTLLASFIFEISNDIINDFLTKLTCIEQFILSPVNDYISGTLKSSKSLNKHLEDQGTSLLDSIGSGEITIKSEH